MWRILARGPLVLSVLLVTAPSPVFALPYTFTLLDVPGATDTLALGLNDRRQIVGDFSDTSGHGFVYTGGTFTPLNAPGAGQTDAFGINQAGRIVGRSIDLGGFHGFLDRPFTTMPSAITCGRRCSGGRGSATASPTRCGTRLRASSSKAVSRSSTSRSNWATTPPPLRWPCTATCSLGATAGR